MLFSYTPTAHLPASEKLRLAEEIELEIAQAVAQDAPNITQGDIYTLIARKLLGKVPDDGLAGFEDRGNSPSPDDIEKTSGEGGDGLSGEAGTSASLGTGEKDTGNS